MIKVGFPELNINPFYMNPIAFTIFGKSVYWYGLIITLGLLTAVFVCTAIAKKDKFITVDNLLDIVLIGLPSAIIGARLYYVIFNFELYIDNLLDIFKLWNGGIAVYGALIAAVISTLVYCTIKKVNFKGAIDVCAIGLVIGQIIGRWGNFTNVEAYGSHTNLPWKMSILKPNWATEIFVHPTFLYESLWNVAVLVLLLYIYKRRKFLSQVFLTYVFAYGLGRYWIEGLRTDSLYWGTFRVSQVLALLSAVVSIGLIIYFSLKRKFLLDEELSKSDIISQSHDLQQESFDNTTKDDTQNQTTDF